MLHSRRQSKTSSSKQPGKLLNRKRIKITFKIKRVTSSWTLVALFYWVGLNFTEVRKPAFGGLMKFAGILREASEILGAAQSNTVSG